MTEIEFNNYCKGKKDDDLKAMYKNITGINFVDEDDNDNIDKEDCNPYMRYTKLDDNDFAYEMSIDMKLMGIGDDSES